MSFSTVLAAGCCPVDAIVVATLVVQCVVAVDVAVL